MSAYAVVPAIRQGRQVKTSPPLLRVAQGRNLPHRTLSAHTNNFSDCCLLIVGTRRIAYKDAITQMA
jgi:hypothetical protein